MAERYSDRSVSQTVRAQLSLRDLILSGDLRARRTDLRIAGCGGDRRLAHSGANGAGSTAGGRAFGSDLFRWFHGKGILRA